MRVNERFRARFLRDLTTSKSRGVLRRDVYARYKSTTSALSERPRVAADHARVFLEREKKTERARFRRRVRLSKRILEDIAVAFSSSRRAAARAWLKSLSMERGMWIARTRARLVCSSREYSTRVIIGRNRRSWGREDGSLRVTVKSDVPSIVDRQRPIGRIGDVE